LADEWTHCGHYSRNIFLTARCNDGNLTYTRASLLFTCAVNIVVASLQETGSSESSVRFTRSADSVSIRGVTIPLAEIVDRRLLDAAYQQTLHNRLVSAKPFPHLVLEGFFNPLLLELILEEFDSLPNQNWKQLKNDYESTRRSKLGAHLEPASQIYFYVLNSGWFTNALSAITGVPYLLSDPKLAGGGLHETRVGSMFGIHKDFNRHRHIGLKNEMVLITYLNKNWNPAWNGALELWDAEQKACVTSVQPEFGTSILMPHGPVSFHGHPAPLQTSDGRPRRSIAAYYYTSPQVGKWREDQVSSFFLKQRRIHRFLRVAKMLTPPLLWSAVRKAAKG
jgi:Rps23 Pro-64 3,4-dihydroxylase Tpa1-like proline 4-hydroxylase